MSKDELIALTKSVANSHSLFTHVICGMCERESSWDPWSIRYEPSFEVRYVEPIVLAGELTDATEVKARSMSWGLLQTMGQSVRELGYKDRLPMLCDPATGLEWGCRLFTRKLGFASGSYTRALQLWNGGSNPAYSTDVLALSAKYQ